MNIVIRDTIKEQRIRDRVKEQRKLIEKLEQFDNKYKKIGLSQRTKQCIRLRLDELHVLWHEFETNHSLIIHQNKINRKSLYMGQNEYVKLERLYYHLIDQFKERLAAAHAGPVAHKPERLKSTRRLTMKQSSSKKIKKEMIEENGGECVPPTSASPQSSTTTTTAAINAKHKVKFIAASKVSNSSSSLANNSDCDQILRHLSIVMRKANDQDENDDEDDDDDCDEDIEVDDDEDESMNDFKMTPKTELPYFNGDFQAWKSFSNIYTAAVHNNQGISGLQKLQFLKSRLIGDAAGLLEHVPLAEENYRWAWKLLTDRFGNVRMLVNEQLRILMSQPNAVETAESLRALLKTTSECVKALKSLHVPTKEWSPILVFIVAQRLPSDTRQFWEQSLSKSELPAFQDMQEFLDNRCFTLDQGVYWVNQIQD